MLRDGRRVGVFPTADMTQRRLTELMTGKPSTRSPRPRPLRRRSCWRSRGLTRAGEYQDVALAVRRGEIVGLTGLLGAGRTELGLSLFGMTRPDRGQILLEGRVRFRSNRDAIRAGIAYVPEDRLTLGLMQPQPIADNIVITVLGRILAGPPDRPGKKADLVGDWVKRLAVKIGRPPTPSRPFRAATSSGSCWPNGSRPNPRC